MGAMKHLMRVWSASLSLLTKITKSSFKYCMYIQRSKWHLWSSIAIVKEACLWCKNCSQDKDMHYIHSDLMTDITIHLLLYPLTLHGKCKFALHSHLSHRSPCVIPRWKTPTIGNPQCFPQGCFFSYSAVVRSQSPQHQDLYFRTLAVE